MNNQLIEAVKNIFSTNTSEYNHDGFYIELKDKKYIRCYTLYHGQNYGNEYIVQLKQHNSECKYDVLNDITLINHITYLEDEVLEFLKTFNKEVNDDKN